MACFVGALIAASVALVRTGTLPSATVVGARSIATIETSPPEAPVQVESALADASAANPSAANPIVPAQDDDAKDADDGDSEGEAEVEKATVKVKYPSAESDFDVELITALPVDNGDEVDNGDLLLEVSNRPMFVFEGSSPAVRSLTVGTSGDDVAQLERALSSLGYSVGAVDGTFDGATAAAVAQFYTDHGYALPDGKESDVEDLQDAQGKLAEAHVKREAALVALASATTPDLVESNDDLLDLQKAEADLKQSELKLNAFRAEEAPLVAIEARYVALRSAIVVGIESGTIDGNDPESISSAIAVELLALTNDDPDEFSDFDEMFEEIEEERLKNLEDLHEVQREIADEKADRDVFESEVDLAWDKIYELPSTEDEDDARADIAKVDVEIQNLEAEIARLAAKTGARMSIDEFVFAPNLPGEIDDLDVDVRDEADGTLLKIKTG